MADDAFATFLADYGRAWSSGEEQELRRVFTDDAVYVEGGMHNDYEGLPEVLRFFRFMLTFSADSTIEFRDVMHDEEQFVAEWVWSGTADGPLKLGPDVLPAAGKQYAVEGVAVCRFGEDGKVAYHKDYYNVLDLVGQLGLGHN